MVDTKRFCRSCDVFQRTGKPSRHDEMLLVPQITLKSFDKWVIYFLCPISPLGKRTSTHYMISATYYLTGWDKASLVKDCTTATATKFLFENVVTRFGCPKILLSHQGMHFVNKMIDELGVEF